MHPVRIAVVDMGSNTLKFSVIEFGADGGMTVIDGQAVTARIGQGVASTGCIAPDRLDAALSALVQYEQRARTMGAVDFTGVATAAVRMATNRRELLTRIERETSWRIEVISGDEEARLIYQGLKSELPQSGTHLIADIGGASTELIQILDGAVLFSHSVQIGSGTLADRWFRSDPPGREAVSDALRDATSVLFGVEDLVPVAGSVLYLSGGNGVFLSQVAVWTRVRIPFVVPFLPMLVERLADVPAVETADYLNITRERARMLPAGGAVAWSLIDRTRPAGLHAIESGIGRGVAASWFAKQQERAAGGA